MRGNRDRSCAFLLSSRHRDANCLKTLTYICVACGLPVLQDRAGGGALGVGRGSAATYMRMYAHGRVCTWKGEGKGGGAGWVHERSQPDAAQGEGKAVRWGVHSAWRCCIRTLYRVEGLRQE